MPIGEYIHYNYKNYLEYGINKIGEGKSPDPIGAYNKQKIQLLEKIKINKKENVKIELENRLNFFRGGNEKLKGLYTQQEIEDMENAVFKIISDSLDKYLINGTGSIDTINLKAFSNNGGLGTGLEKGGARWQLENNGRNQIGAVQFRLIQMRSAIEKMANDGMASAATLMTQLTNLESMYEDVASSLSLESLGLGAGQTRLTASDIKTEKGYLHQGYINFNALTGKNFIASLNDLWLEFKQQVNSFVQGQLAEEYAALAVGVAGETYKINEDDLMNFLNKTLSGSKRGFATETHGIALSNVITSYFTKAGGNRVATDGLISTSGKALSAKQGKVDLTVNLEELGEFNLSIKNYSNMGNGASINIHSGSSILMLMQQYSDFMNHYLNITTSKGSNGVNGALGQEMKLMLKMSLLAHGLIGEYTTTTGLGQKADVLVTVENGLFKVYFMDDIINKIIQNPDLAEIKGFDTLKLSNTWVAKEVNGKIKNYAGAYARINNLLAQLNSFKLDMSINVNLLR